MWRTGSTSSSSTRGNGGESPVLAFRGEGEAVIVIYHGQGGVATPAVCAHIHVGRLPEGRRPTAAELFALPGLEPIGRREVARVRRVGRDAGGNDVCFLRRRADFVVLERAVRQVGRELGVSTADLVYVDVMPRTNLLVRGAAWIGRRLRLRGLSRGLAAHGILSAYPRLVALAHQEARVLAGGGGDARSRHRPTGEVRVFYYCYGCSHTSVVAAAIHSGRLGPRRTPTAAQLVSLRHFDRIRVTELGTVFPAGRGPRNERIYVVGLGPGRTVIRQAIASVLHLKGVPASDYVLVDALARANWLVKVGGMLSRRLGLVAVGRPIVTAGIRLVFPGLVALVAQTQAEVAKRLS